MNTNDSNMTISLTAPTEVFYKSRRFTVISSSLLLLTIYVGLSPSDTDSGSTIFQLKLDNPDYLSTIFLLVAFYAVWQFWTSWYVQTQEVRNYAVNKADCLFTGSLAICAIVSFFYKFSTWQFWVLSLVSLGVWFFVFVPATRKLNLAALRKRKEKDKAINSVLVGEKWNLLFNPKTNRSKSITFLDDGNIGEGKNDNETTWRIREGLLEILNKDGKVFSRFRYQQDENSFEHTNDEDTLSIRYQTITKANN